MGWLVVIAAKPLLAQVPQPGLLWLLAGGLSYTLGVLFYLVEKTSRITMPFGTCFVLAGGICHYFAILFYVLP